jgi:hypothetical protein
VFADPGKRTNGGKARLAPASRVSGDWRSICL